MKWRWSWLWGGLLGLVLLSWACSFWWPHWVGLPFHSMLFMENGTIQLRHESEKVPAVDEKGNVTVQDSSKFGSWPTRPPGGMQSVRLVVSSLSPYSHAWLLSGGTVSLTNGTAAEFGYRVDVRAIAHWVFVIPLIVLFWFARHRENRLSRNPHGCRKCGYDLRASPERCPECGTLVGKAVQVG